jgi:hypothetical protein
LKTLLVTFYACSLWAFSSGALDDYDFMLLALQIGCAFSLFFVFLQCLALVNLIVMGAVFILFDASWIEHISNFNGVLILADVAALLGVTLGDRRPRFNLS